VGRVVDREVFDTNPDLTSDVSQVAFGDTAIHQDSREHRRDRCVCAGTRRSGNRNALFIPHFKWRNWALASDLHETTGLPVTTDNDANAAALAELWLGRPEIRDVRDFVLVLVEEGVGTGIIFDGQVYQGVAGAAGEFGHMTIGRELRWRVRREVKSVGKRLRQSVRVSSLQTATRCRMADSEITFRKIDGQCASRKTTLRRKRCSRRRITLDWEFRISPKV
jgi:predicted NBD/HSP70 family sugar kinase